MSNEESKANSYKRYIERFNGMNTVEGEALGPGDAVIVTGNGSANGLGRYISSSLTSGGIYVFGIDNEYEYLYDKSGDYYQNRIGDIYDNNGLINSMFAAAEEKGLTIRALINNAAVTEMNWFEDIGDELEDTFESNLFAVVRASQRFIENTISSKARKYIINIGSMAYDSVLNSSAAYCSSKAALMMLTRCMAWELSIKNYVIVQVNPSSIAGSGMEADIVADLMRCQGMSRDEAIAYWNAGKRLGRLITKQDIVNAIMPILNGKMDYLSGSSIDFRGGQR